MRRKWFTTLVGIGAATVIVAGLAAGVGSAGQSVPAKGYKIYLLPKNPT